MCYAGQQRQGGARKDVLMSPTNVQTVVDQRKQLDRVEAKIDALTVNLASITGLFALIESSPMVQGMLGTGPAPSPMEMMRAMMGPKG